MPDGRLLIGNKRYSSWSHARLAGRAPGGARRGGGGDPLHRRCRPGHPGDRRRHPGRAGALPGTPAAHRVWESLSICEYCAEQAARPLAGGPRRARPGPVHLGRDACRLPRPAPGHVVQCRRRLRRRSAARPTRCGTSPASRRLGARRSAAHGGPFLFGAALRHGGCHVRPGGRPLPDLAAGAVGGHPGLYGRGAGASAGRALVCRRRWPSPPPGSSPATKPCQRRDHGARHRPVAADLLRRRAGPHGWTPSIAASSRPATSPSTSAPMSATAPRSFRRLGARVVAVEPQPRLARLLRLLSAGMPA